MRSWPVLLSIIAVVLLFFLSYIFSLHLLKNAQNDRKTPDAGKINFSKKVEITFSGRIKCEGYKGGRISVDFSNDRINEKLKEYSGHAELSEDREYRFSVEKNAGRIIVEAAYASPDGGLYIGSREVNIGAEDITGLVIMLKRCSNIVQESVGKTVTISGKVMYRGYEGRIEIKIVSPDESTVNSVIIPRPGDFNLIVPANIGTVYTRANAADYDPHPGPPTGGSLIIGDENISDVLLNLPSA